MKIIGSSRILRTTCQELKQVIVVDTGSTDQTLSIIANLQREGLPITLICHREPPNRFSSSSTSRWNA